MAQFESLRFGRAEPQDVGIRPVMLRQKPQQRWKPIVGALVLLAIVVTLIALSRSGPDFAENIISMG